MSRHRHRVWLAARFGTDPKRAVVSSRDEDGVLQMRFRRAGTFVSKPGIVTTLEAMDDGERVVIDGSDESIDHDVKELLATFLEDAHRRNIDVTIRGIDLTNAKAGGGH